MDRRAFLTGLCGVAGAVTLAGLTIPTADAAPLARPLSMPISDLPAELSDIAQTPDGTPVELAQYYRRRHRRRFWRRHWRRRRWRRRLVCRTYRVRRGWVRRCRRVW